MITRMKNVNSFCKSATVICFIFLCGTSLFAQLSLKNTNWSGSFKTVAEEKISLQFGDDTLNVKTANNNEVVSVMTFEQRQDTLIISSTGGKNRCETGRGTYHITYAHSGQQLSLKAVQDSCSYRNNLFTDSRSFNFIPDENSAARDWLQLDPATNSLAGMSLYKAYELLKGRSSKSVVVAVIDNGVDIEHEDLKNIIWTNSKEIPNNEIDDDKNGYVDDIHGWNFRGAKDGSTVENEQSGAANIYSSWKNKYDKIDANRLSRNEKKRMGYLHKSQKRISGKN